MRRARLRGLPSTAVSVGPHPCRELTGRIIDVLLLFEPISCRGIEFREASRLLRLSHGFELLC